MLTSAAAANKLTLHICGDPGRAVFMIGCVMA